ncbi:hypothetical protein LINPERHAP2_LOCUS43557 [Linum perenne]
MEASGGATATGGDKKNFVYRISTATEYEKLQKDGSTHGGEIDTSSRFIHLSDLNQVMSTLNNFFRNVDTDLFLLQIDAQKLGEGLVYESVDGINSFPHFYGPDRSFVPLPLDAVVKSEKISVSDGKFSCGLLC